MVMRSLGRSYMLGDEYSRKMIRSKEESSKVLVRRYMTERI